MITLTVTSKGQVTLRKEVLAHLGVHPGEKIVVDLLPNGHASLKVAKPTGSITDLFGLLKDRTNKVATIDEMNDAIAKGWAGEL